MSLAYSYAFAAVVAASGCSLVYDADDLRAGRDGGGGPTADADPDALFVARVTPDSVFEGEGSSFDEELTDVVRAIPIVLEGQNMTAETVFTIEGLGLDMEIDDVAVSGDGHFAAFALRVPILEDLTDGDQSADIAIRLAKGDEEANAPLVDVTGLDALEVVAGGTLDTDTLHARYTQVDLAGDVVATGTAPLRIVATAGIRITDTLRADAGNAPNAGPGGCPGGGPTNDADCGPGSGEVGENSGSPGGGGGGGYGTGGDAGTGGAGGAGEVAGQRFVAPLPPADGADAHGAGGGGGGALTLDAAGAGGGSGGVVELTTPAILSLSSTAVVSAAGGDGDPPPTSCATGGGGGGGSGGAILLRAATLVATAGATAAALGGDGAGGGSCVGGGGGKGRIRIDRGNEAAVDADPAAFVGPMPIIDDLQVIVDTASLSLPIRGDSNTNYEVYINDQETPATFETDGDGLGTADVTLEPGLNQLCVYVADKTDFDVPEAKNCVNVAYIKP